MEENKFEKIEIPKENLIRNNKNKQERLDEIEAQKVLSRLFEEYKNLIINDKPDLIDFDRSIGVEVTRAVFNNVEKHYGDYEKKLKDKLPKSIEEKKLLEMRQAHVNFICKDDGKISGLYRILTKEEIKLLNERIREKYNKKYKRLTTIDLYIFFRQWFIECLSAKDIESMFTTAHECKMEKGKGFRKIIIDFYDKLLILNLEDGSVKEVLNYAKP